MAQLKSELDQLRVSNREEEAKLKKKKTKSEQEVEIWIQEYDKDMRAKEKVYQDELGVYNEIVEQLQRYEEHYDKLRKEVEDANAKELANQKARDEAEQRERKRDEAAGKIQALWKQFKQSNAEGEKAGAKGKGKGK